LPTTTRGYRYPAGSAAPNVPVDVANLASDIDDDMTASTAGAWTAFTPVWKGATTDPTLGNGRLSARYQKIGPKTVIYYGQLEIGSTTTFGSGTWSMSLPIGARLTSPPGSQVFLAPGSAFLFDNNGATNRTSGVSLLFGSADIYFAAPGASSINATTPFTWATADQLDWFITYETV
jgi:hypothetical protein